MIARLARTCAVLSGFSSAMSRIRDRRRLFDEACGIAVRHGSYRMAWVGVPEAGTNELSPVAQAGFDGGYLREVVPLLRDAGEDRGALGQALRRKKTVVVNDLKADPNVACKKAALARGYRSMASLPVLVDGRVAALFVLYSAQTGFFDGDELALLKHLAGHISLALKCFEKEEKLNHLAYYDVLTKSANRSLLRDRLTLAIANAGRHGRQVAVISVDIDNFKYINNSLGHKAGDQLLKSVTERLGSCVRDGDTIARQGGDEFVIVLPDQVSDEHASQVIKRILAAIAQPISIGEREFNITCSIGASFYPQDGSDGETILKNADAAMYGAKELGRNTFQFYAKEIDAKINERLMLENSLRRAVEREEFLLQYQPQIHLNRGKITGAEALIRWQHPELGMVSPDKFIPLAEETGLIEPIGEWVLRTACAQNKAWQDARLPAITVSINLSARQFRHKGLAETIARALRETGLKAECLGLELTESLVMHNAAAGALMLGNLKQMGVKLSIDDFGTGYSSLSYLRRFPIDELKIDQSFVRDVMTDPDDAIIAKAIIALAHGLNLRVTAEGVETKEHIDFLQGRRCDQAQGFYFSKPLHSREFEELLQQKSLMETTDRRTH
ncbi:MAG: EAL domain-containing protein [Betaproteobacteria bacterium]|nr:MAG: EAL domain-containing protein [Betaproteobacteria bacterium]